MKEQTPLSHEVVCFQMLDFEIANSKSEVSKSNSWKITSFSKTTSLQREPFLTMFYTINLSPILVTKKGFMLIIILSIYQQCPLPLNRGQFRCKQKALNILLWIVCKSEPKLTKLKISLDNNLLVYQALKPLDTIGNYSKQLLAYKLTW